MPPRSASWRGSNTKAAAPPSGSHRKGMLPHSELNSCQGTPFPVSSTAATCAGSAQRGCLGRSRALGGTKGRAHSMPLVLQYMSGSFRRVLASHPVSQPRAQVHRRAWQSSGSAGGSPGSARARRWQGWGLRRGKERGLRAAGAKCAGSARDMGLRAASAGVPEPRMQASARAPPPAVGRCAIHTTARGGPTRCLRGSQIRRCVRQPTKICRRLSETLRGTRHLQRAAMGGKGC